ncbi:MAG: pseudoazurin [Pseudomonadota bacterium]
MTRREAGLGGLAVAGLALVGASPPAPKTWEVRMLNKGPDGAMAFAPGMLAIRPGDSVRFVATDKGHNAETIAGMLPAGAAPFKGKINEEIVVKFTVPGVYGYKCLPHFAMGMVGLIRVGTPANLAAAVAQAEKLPALARKRMLGFLAAA